jgi:hypothetical protein
LDLHHDIVLATSHPRQYHGSGALVTLGQALSTRSSNYFYSEGLLSALLKLVNLDSFAMLMVDLVASLRSLAAQETSS